MVDFDSNCVHISAKSDGESTSPIAILASQIQLLAAFVVGGLAFVGSYYH